MREDETPSPDQQTVKEAVEGSIRNVQAGQTNAEIIGTKMNFDTGQAGFVGKLNPTTQISEPEQPLITPEPLKMGTVGLPSDQPKIVDPDITVHLVDAPALHKAGEGPLDALAGGHADVIADDAPTRQPASSAATETAVTTTTRPYDPNRISSQASPETQPVLPPRLSGRTVRRGLFATVGATLIGIASFLHLGGGQSPTVTAAETPTPGPTPTRVLPIEAHGGSGSLADQQKVTGMIIEDRRAAGPTSEAIINANSATSTPITLNNKP